eukprot:Selendium_serpulae@DN6337_c2_g1_i10.p2
MEFPERLQQVLDSTHNLSESLDPILRTDSNDGENQKKLQDIMPELTGRDTAKLCVGLAFVTASLAWAQVRLRGDDPKDHPVTRELDRIKGYFKRVFTVYAEDDDENPFKRRRVLISREGASRVVQHYTETSRAPLEEKVETNVVEKEEGAVTP